MGHQKAPNEGHHRLMADTLGRCGRATLEGIAPIEQIAVLAQAIGKLIDGLDPRQHEVRDVMQSVALNIASGNGAPGAGGIPLIGAGVKPS